MNIFEEPVSLTGFQLVKTFAAQLSHLPEERQLPQTSFDMWSAPLAETGANLDEMRLVGEWYAKHHQTGPSLGYIIHAAQELKLRGSLPPHRIAGEIERNAMAILLAAQQLGLSAGENAQAIMLAGTLAHLSLYRRKHPHVGREYLRTEIEGMARMSDYVADEILDEIAAGVGDLKELDKYLLGISASKHQGDA